MGTAKTGTVNIISNFIKNYLNIMKRKYITIAGKKFYCDEKANLEKDADGKVTQLILTQGGRNIPAKKIK